MLQTGHITLSGPQPPHLSHLDICTPLIWVLTLRGAKPGERAWTECPHLLSTFNWPPPHSPCVPSSSLAETHLHSLCLVLVPVPHHPGAPNTSRSLYLLGIRVPRVQNLECGSLHFGQDLSFAVGHGSHGWLSVELG